MGVAEGEGLAGGVTVAIGVSRTGSVEGTDGVGVCMIIGVVVGAGSGVGDKRGSPGHSICRVVRSCH